MNFEHEFIEEESPLPINLKKQLEELDLMNTLKILFKKYAILPEEILILPDFENLIDNFKFNTYLGHFNNIIIDLFKEIIANKNKSTIDFNEFIVIFNIAINSTFSHYSGIITHIIEKKLNQEKKMYINQLFSLRKMFHFYSKNSDCLTKSQLYEIVTYLIGYINILKSVLPISYNKSVTIQKYIERYFHNKEPSNQCSEGQITFFEFQDLIYNFEKIFRNLIKTKLFRKFIGSNSVDTTERLSSQVIHPIRQYTNSVTILIQGHGIQYTNKIKKISANVSLLSFSGFSDTLGYMGFCPKQNKSSETMVIEKLKEVYRTGESQYTFNSLPDILRPIYNSFDIYFKQDGFKITYPKFERMFILQPNPYEDSRYRPNYGIIVVSSSDVEDNGFTLSGIRGNLFANILNNDYWFEKSTLSEERIEFLKHSLRNSNQRKISLSNLILFFKSMGFDNINIIDPSCRGVKSSVSGLKLAVMDIMESKGGKTKKQKSKKNKTRKK